MPLQAVEPQRLYRQIADQLRTLIQSGEFVAGSRLPAERDLAKQLGVSRPSVREALIALEVEGWVEVRTGSGVYVLDRALHQAAEHKPITTEWGRLGGYFETVQSWRSAIAEHTTILDAIAAHDGPAARAAMHTHMDKSHHRFSASWRRAKAA